MFSKEILTTLNNLQYNLYAIVEGKPYKIKKIEYPFIEFIEVGVEKSL